MSRTAGRKTQVKRIVAGAMLAAAGLAPSLALAGPEGTYDMTGTNPGDKSPYKGVVEVRRTGETYAVTWRFGSEETQGIGALAAHSDRIFAVSYGAGKGHGIALFELRGDGSWSGTWSNLGGETLGTEVWQPQGHGMARTPASASTPGGQDTARR